MARYVERAGLQIADELASFIEERVLPGTGIAAEPYWSGAADIFARFVPRNRALLARRDEIQASIDEWHTARAGKPFLTNGDETHPHRHASRR